MNRRLFLSLVLGGIALALGSPLHATTTESAPSCASAYGDIWSEDQPDVPAREIDGASIGSPADFMRMTSTREAGLKIIQGGDFSGWDFSEIPLANICFENSKLAGSRFAGVRARSIGFIKSELTGSNMRGARMPEIFFRNANLSGVSAQGADFSGGHFDGGWFEGGVGGWNLDGANLTGFVFDCGITVQDGCPVYQGEAEISAKGADFSRATLHSFNLHNIDLSGARLDQTILGPGQLPHLNGADLRGEIILRGGSKDVLLDFEEAKFLLTENARQKAKEANPSFDCAKAVSKVELEICGEYAQDIRAIDRDIAATYLRARETVPGVRGSQQAWLKERNRCGEAEYPPDCIRESYNIRYGQLLALLGEVEWLARGEAALFIDDLLPLSAQAVSSEVFRKIAPVLVNASRTEILIERGIDGLYTIKGNAIGANAHMCSIDASNLDFDKASGWYVAISEGAPIPIFRIFNDRLEIFADGRPDYETHPEAGDFMSCGMRASLDVTVRVRVNDEIIEDYRKSLREEM